MQKDGKHLKIHSSQKSTTHCINKYLVYTCTCLQTHIDWIKQLEKLCYLFGGGGSVLTLVG